MRRRTGYSRFPVQEGEELSATCTSRTRSSSRTATATARSPARGSGRWPWSTPPTRCATVLATMQRDNAHLARVDDADGAVLGVAALEDVLEELVGEIRDDTQRVLAR